MTLPDTTIGRDLLVRFQPAALLEHEIPTGRSDRMKVAVEVVSSPLPLSSGHEGSLHVAP